MPTAYREYKSDADKVKVYDHRLRQAETAFEKWSNKAFEWLARYENRANPAQYTPAGVRTSVPTGTSIIDALYSSLTAADVDLIVTADGAGTSDQEDLATAALSKEWELCRVNERAGEAIKDALVTSWGWLKVGYEYYTEERDVPRDDAAIEAD